ncbi:DUF559 domain-containing protein [Thermopirellula anaerolimosa]
MFEHCPRLIEVALPIREISAESVRDKSLRHGHISTLHLWWARRPLAASRAVVFASLVPDPDDPSCPAEFRDAVERHLKTHVPAELKYYTRGRKVYRDEDPYRPYEGMPDTLRNRLLMFIAKWSPESLAFEAGKAKKEPDPKCLLDDRSLVKWETSAPENPQGREVLRVARGLVRAAHGGEVPTVLDPFAGGGAIPLEAGRLGCQAIANDYNPVAYLILRATCEFPQKYGKPGKRKVVVEEFGKRVELEVQVPNVLVHDVEKWANSILERARERIGHLYPPGKDGRPVVGYLWARTVPCSNPSCRAEIPLLRSLLICNKKDKKVALTMHLMPTSSPLPPGATPHSSPLPPGEGQGEGLGESQAEDNPKGQKPALAPQFLAFIRNLRREQTDAERLLWSILRDRRFFGLKFRRQHPAGRYVLDFYCHEHKVAVEIDGGQHFTEEGMRRDARREAFLKSQGIHVLRYTNLEVLENLEGVLEDIARKLGVMTGSVQPSPQPSPNGRGGQPSPQPSPKGRGRVWFGIAEGEAITRTEGTKRERGPAICPFCEQPTSEAELRRAGQAGQMGERMVAVIVEGKDGKEYRPVEEADLAAFREAAKIEVERPGELILPEINAEGADDVANSTGIRVHLYGMKTWGSLFNPRQLVAMQTFVACLREALEQMREEIPDEEYRRAVGVYLGLFISRIASRCSNVGLWNSKGENVEHPFGRQAIPMTWDYPEVNPFSESTGGALGQLAWMLGVITHESIPSSHAQVHRGDGAALSLRDASCDVVVTDPPYFDAIAYGDLSDYFYVWIKRAIGDLVPEAAATPLTPKTDEATALKHRHGGDGEKADAHFKSKLAAVLAEAHRLLKPGGVIAIMFAHQSTKAWTALVHAIFESGLTVDATWPIDTERTFALKASMSALASSVTVLCRPRIVGSAASFKQVRKEIEQVVKESVKRFWSYGFRGADLIVACYGPAVGVFGKYEHVEKADGTPVGIPELLDLAKQAAREAIAGEFRGDNISTLYYVWANLYGTAEQAWDDARLVVQIGGAEENAMERAHERLAVVIQDHLGLRTSAPSYLLNCLVR